MDTAQRDDSGKRRPVRTITWPPISSRRIRFGEPTSPALRRDRRRLQPEPVLADRSAASWTIRSSSRAGSRARGRSGGARARARPRPGARRGAPPRAAPARSGRPRERRSSVRRAPRIPASTVAAFDGMRADGLDAMARSGRFRYIDARGERITDAAKLDRIEELKIPPAWRDVRISPRRREAPGDGLRQGRAEAVPLPPGISRRAGAGEVRQAGPLRRALPAMRARMARASRRGAALASASAASRSGSSTSLVPARGRPLRAEGLRRDDAPQEPRQGARNKIAFAFTAKHGIRVRTPRRRRARPGAAPPARRAGRRGPVPVRAGRGSRSTSRAAAERLHPGAISARSSARRTSARGVGRSSRRSRSPSAGRPRSEAEAKRAVPRLPDASRSSSETRRRFARASYISPAVVEQYLEGRTIDDSGRAICASLAHAISVSSRKEQALLSLLRSWRIRRARRRHSY